jgi:hypothetical protein
MYRERNRIERMIGHLKINGARRFAAGAQRLQTRDTIELTRAFQT